VTAVCEPTYDQTPTYRQLLYVYRKSRHDIQFYARAAQLYCSFQLTSFFLPVGHGKMSISFRVE